MVWRLCKHYVAQFWFENLPLVTQYLFNGMWATSVRSPSTAMSCTCFSLTCWSTQTGQTSESLHLHVLNVVTPHLLNMMTPSICRPVCSKVVLIRSEAAKTHICQAKVHYSCCCLEQYCMLLLIHYVVFFFSWFFSKALRSTSNPSSRKKINLERKRTHSLVDLQSNQINFLLVV